MSSTQLASAMIVASGRSFESATPCASRRCARRSSRSPHHCDFRLEERVTIGRLGGIALIMLGAGVLLASTG
jgi:hypothetical protein